MSVGGLAQQTSNERFAYDSYRRFVQMFGKIVLDIDGDKFEHALTELRASRRASPPTPSCRPKTLQDLVGRFKAIVLAETGIEFPQDPQEQLRHAIEAVFRSWNGDRARDLPPRGEDPRRPRHRGERADDGVRQQGRRLGHRRRVHP